MTDRARLRREAAERSRQRRRARGEMRQLPDAEVQVGAPDPGPPCTLCSGAQVIPMATAPDVLWASMTCPRCNGRGVDPGL